MEIKRVTKKKVITGLKNKSWVSWIIVSLITNFLLVCLVISIVLFTGIHNYFSFKMKYVIKNQIKHLIAMYKANPQQISIDIKYKDFQRLAYKREESMDSGILITGAQDYVPATIQYKDKSVKAKIRLKGDLVWDNLQGEKWSFRIEVKGDDSLFGMKRFSIHHPKVRYYIYEWIFHQALKREGILSLRYEFIKVILNGKNLGIYALEEHFEKQLVEHNQGREGIIIKFNEDILWADRKEHFLYNKKSFTQLQSEFSSNIDAFKMNRILEDPYLYKQFFVAKNLLELFRRGKLPAHKVFDIKKLAKYLAISELTGGIHGTTWHNLRFYYNPVTSFLEPVGFDAMAGFKMGERKTKINEAGVTTTVLRFYDKIFSDFVFFEEYAKALNQVSDFTYLDEFFLNIDEDLKKNLDIIHSEFPDFHFSKDVLYKNQRYIRLTLNPLKGIFAYFHQSFKEHIELELGNIQSMPVEVLNVTYKDSVALKPLERVILSPKLRAGLVDYKNVSFKFPENFIWSKEKIKDLVVNYKILGMDIIKQEKVFPWSYLNKNFIKNDFIRQKSNIHKFKFLIVNEKTKRIFIKPGSWKIDQSLVIPKGYMVIGKEGTQLNLLNSAKILSYSPIKLIGSEENAIVIGSSNSTGQGIIVMDSSQKSILKYVSFDNLSNPSQSGWQLSGAVTFYNSSVDMQHCRFFNNNSEDALNLIHSEFTINETLFIKTSFDAIDVDFSKGEITNCSFVNCGNDAIDFSGSIVEMQNIFVKGIGDKALSVGENSWVKVEQIDIKNAKIAAVSKDLSTTIIELMKISDCEIGLAVYQKKSEFGPGFMKASKLNIDKVSIPYLVEDKSELKIDGKLIKSNKANVEQILSRGGNVKRSSK